MNQAENSDTLLLPFYLLQPADTCIVEEEADDDYLLMCNDTVFAPFANSTPVYRRSMFAENSLACDQPQPIPRTPPASSDWLFITVIALLVIISTQINTHKFRTKDILLSLFDIRNLDRVSRESNIKPHNLMPMTFIYLADIALLAFYAVRQSSFRSPVGGLELYLAIVAALIVFITLKNSIIRILGNVFEDKGTTAVYITSNYLFYYCGALLVTPLELLLFFNGNAAKATFIAMLALTGGLLAARLIRGIQLILTNSKTSKLYLFYYLCIVEIVPILVAAKSIFF